MSVLCMRCVIAKGPGEADRQTKGHKEYSLLHHNTLARFASPRCIISLVVGRRTPTER